MDFTLDVEQEYESAREDLKTAWKQLLLELREDEVLTESKSVIDWVETVMEENVPLGKQHRGRMTVLAYRCLAREDQRSKENDFLACVGGWCAEILHTSGLIVDDIMDGSKTRRGKPAWYTNPQVGLKAITDARVLVNLIWRILKKYFGQNECYEQLVKLIEETSFLTALGQVYDIRGCINPDFSKYNSKYYDTTVKYKTSIYTYYAPVAVALILGKVKQHIFDSAKDILCDIGRMFQIQDDYLDLYGDPEITGKIGTDIQDGKCTWFIVEALKICTEQQKSILKENYGIDTIENVDKIKKVYRELKLKSVYKKYEKDMFLHIKGKINTDECLTKAIKANFTFLLDEIYEREK